MGIKVRPAMEDQLSGAVQSGARKPQSLNDASDSKEEELFIVHIPTNPSSIEEEGVSGFNTSEVSRILQKENESRPNKSETSNIDFTVDQDLCSLLLPNRLIQTHFFRCYILRTS